MVWLGTVLRDPVSFQKGAGPAHLETDEQAVWTGSPEGRDRAVDSAVASIWLSLEPAPFSIHVLFFFSAESQITEQVVSGSHLNVA